MKKKSAKKKSAKKKSAKKKAANRKSGRPDPAQGALPNVHQFRVDVWTLMRLMEESGHTTGSLAEAAGFGIGVIGKMLRGESVEVWSAQAVAKVLGLELADLGEHVAVLLTSPELYPLCGLSNRTRRVDETMNAFQNFVLGDDPKRPPNYPPINNPIGYLWAEAQDGSFVRANVRHDATSESPQSRSG